MHALPTYTRDSHGFYVHDRFPHVVHLTRAYPSWNMPQIYNNIPPQITWLSKKKLFENGTLHSPGLELSCFNHWRKRRCRKHHYVYICRNRELIKTKKKSFSVFYTACPLPNICSHRAFCCAPVCWIVWLYFSEYNDRSIGVEHTTMYT